MSNIVAIYYIPLYERQDGTYSWWEGCLDNVAITDSPDAFFQEYIDQKYIKLNSKRVKYSIVPEGDCVIYNPQDLPKGYVMLSSDDRYEGKFILWAGDGSRDPKVLGYLISHAVYRQMDLGYDSSEYYHLDLGDDSLEYRLCKLAGLEEEFKNARNGDIGSVRSVVSNAAEILEVRVPALEPKEWE